tara:strand:- start:84 stop:479 length:396 start_codon:yes stop_codon:yes gene_type:complete
MTWDYRAEWKRRLNKIIKYFKEHEVEIIRTNEYIHSVDLICCYKRKIKVLKLITDKENQYTLEMDILTKKFNPYYHVVSNLKQASEVVLGSGKIETPSPVKSLHKHLQKVTISENTEKDIAFNKFIQWRRI